MPPFHLAIPVDDLEAARNFYGKLLGCPEGRSSDRWVDFNLHGHQVVAHLHEGKTRPSHNSVDGDSVPVPHFGLVLEWGDWEGLASRLEEAGTEFIIPPRIRFQGEVGEQGTMFFQDPAGNHLEFKTFRDPKQLFAH